MALKDFVIPNTELIPEEVRSKVKKWSDYIDYWAVDWDFRNDTFMQGWVTYRTRKERKLPLNSDTHAYEKTGQVPHPRQGDRHLRQRHLAGLRRGGEVVMAEAVIAYDKDLPEIPGRRPWEKPTSYLIKDDAAETGWRVDESSRRPSRLLLVPKIRAAVDAWREGGYKGASTVTRRLFEYWFEEDHEVPGFGVPFRYYFCQREGIETLVWLVEVNGQRDAWKLIQAHATIFEKDFFTKNITFQTTMDGRRQLRRYVPELDAEGVQDLPPEDLRRIAFKMATGSGKTWVMAMAIVWARLPQAARAGLGIVDKLPDRRAERDRLSAAGARLCRQSDLS